MQGFQRGQPFRRVVLHRPRLQERGRLFRQKDVYPEDARRTDGALFMNGLALLRLAELSGRPTQREDPNIPHLARLPVGKPPLPLDPRGDWPSSQPQPGAPTPGAMRREESQEPKGGLPGGFAPRRSIAVRSRRRSSEKSRPPTQEAPHERASR